ncbi:MAG: hypothetical protein HY702_05330 [Gemmatimonadetes bacterium]|nr:hypothetical protein [Gemmatimonadota bacterium]
MGTLKRWSVVLACLLPLAGCKRSGDLVVQAALGRDTAGAPVGIDKLVLELLPYNRDSIFDALARQAATPEPQIPEDLLVQRDSVAALRDLWTQSESQWNAVRDELLKLSERMRTMDRGSREYFQAFTRFTDLEQRERTLSRAKDEAFRSYDALQKRYGARADSIKVVRFAWEDEAFARYGEITEGLPKTLKRETYADTTSGGGYATFRNVRNGRWYLYTRYELPFQELYFNIPVEIRGGSRDTLMLTRDTAELRPLL